MNIADAILYAFPDADPSNDFIVEDHGDGVQVLTYWNLPHPPLTTWELQSYWLDLCKIRKIEEVDRQCTATIHGGFVSSNGHTYGFDGEDQDNMAQKHTLFMEDVNAPGLPWRTKDAGPIFHTRAEFLALCKEAEIFKFKNIAAYWQLVYQINAALTPEDVFAFTLVPQTL